MPTCCGHIVLLYQEAGDPLDYALQANLARYYDLPLATGRTYFFARMRKNLILYEQGMRPDRD